MTNEAPEMFRFHLTFSYENPDKGWRNSGSQVVRAINLQHAAEMLMRERSLQAIFIKARHHSNGQTDAIDSAFKMGGQS